MQEQPTHVATNAQQSRTVFYSKLKSRLQSHCFKEFGPVIGATQTVFPSINLRLHSVHAANESWEGLNILAWVMDEASAFRAAGGQADNSGAVYSTLRTSANSRFASMRWIGLIISFPRKQVNDFTLDKYKQSLTSPTMFGDLASTWEVNPQYDPAHPLFKNFPWVTIDELNVRVPKPFGEEFLKDPTDCKTKYLCQPPPQIGGFFEIPHKLDECVDQDLQDIILKNVEDVVEAVATYYGIQRITFDRWNSAPSVQSLIEKGFFAEDLSFSNAQQLGMYRNLKLLVHNNMITWPANDDLLLELKFLKLENGKVTVTFTAEAGPEDAVDNVNMSGIAKFVGIPIAER